MVLFLMSKVFIKTKIFFISNCFKKYNPDYSNSTKWCSETVLTKIVEEFSKNNFKQIVVMLKGATSDFNYESIKNIAEFQIGKETVKEYLHFLFN